MDVLLDVLAVVLIIAANAFFVMAEYAIVTARRSRLEQRAQAGSKGAAAAVRLMDDPTRVISAVQIAISALGILLGAIGEPIVREAVGGFVPSWLSYALGFLVVTYLSVAFGELVPKAIALHAAERLAIAIARPIDLFARSTAPAVWLLQKSGQLILRPLGIPGVTAGDSPVTREELRGVLQEAEEHGELGAEEEDMLTGVIDMRLREAADVMRPWEDVDVVRLDEPAEQVIDTMLGAAHTRFPALRGDGDIAGVLHARDAWTAWRASGEPPDLAGLLRDPVIVPPSVRVDALLRHLRRARQQLAVVVDEYGRPAGIVTVEDILEEIVGEIEDEFDVLDERFELVEEHVWLVDGAVSVSDFNRRTGASVDPGRARSVGGVVFTMLGRVPEVGEQVALGSVTLAVEAMDGHRIELLRATLSGAQVAS